MTDHARVSRNDLPSSIAMNVYGCVPVTTTYVGSFVARFAPVVNPRGHSYILPLNPDVASINPGFLERKLWRGKKT
jgi:hypothetical protein